MVQTVPPIYIFDFLINTYLFFFRIKVTPEEEEEMVNELFEFWCETQKDRDIDALRVKAYNLVTSARAHNN